MEHLVLVEERMIIFESGAAFEDCHYLSWSITAWRGPQHWDSLAVFEYKRISSNKQYWVCQGRPAERKEERCSRKALKGQERRDDWRDHGGTQDGYLGLGLDILRAIFFVYLYFLWYCSQTRALKNTTLSRWQWPSRDRTSRDLDEPSRWRGWTARCCSRSGTSWVVSPWLLK